MAFELSGGEREMLQSMEKIAVGLPDVPDDAVQIQLGSFETLAGIVGSYCWEPAVRLLRQTAEKCGGELRRKRVLGAAEALAARVVKERGSQLPEFGVWHFFPGIAVRVTCGFNDYDGCKVEAGEILHFRERHYFHHDDGHTLIFRERVIRLSGNRPGERAVIDNLGNAFFEPLPEAEALKGCLAAIDEQWTLLGLGFLEHAAPIRRELEYCRQWLARPEPRGPAPICLTAPLAAQLFPDTGRTLGLARLIAFLFVGTGSGQAEACPTDAWSSPRPASP